MFLPPLLTQLGGLEPGEGSSSGGPGASARSLWSSGGAGGGKAPSPAAHGRSQSIPWPVPGPRASEVTTGKDVTPAAPAASPQSWQLREGIVPGMREMCNPKAAAAGVGLCEASPAEPPIAPPAPLRTQPGDAPTTLGDLHRWPCRAEVPAPAPAPRHLPGSVGHGTVPASPAPWPALGHSAFNAEAPTPPLPSISVRFTARAFAAILLPFILSSPVSPLTTRGRD